MMETEFSSRVSVVVGGSSGIGRATAELLADRGSRVAVVGPQIDEAKAVADAIVEGGGEAIALAADVREKTQVDSAFASIAGEFGGIDVLVCSVGIQRYGTVTATEPEVWDEVFAVNVRGAFLSCRAALPYLRRSPGGGAIVLVSSVQAFVTQTDVAAYTASKGAINALVRSMAVDEATHGVRVNAVCPGSVDTPMLRASAAQFGGAEAGAVDKTIRDWGRSHPLGRVARADEVAEVIAFLASKRASFVTGESVRVDGGLAVKLAVHLPAETPGS
jgi:NAD(P)-dependent dehydrogenase (short-subunit alcohol dehydrogenase family)